MQSPRPQYRICLAYSTEACTFILFVNEGSSSLLGHHDQLVTREHACSAHQAAAPSEATNQQMVASRSLNSINHALQRRKRVGFVAHCTKCNCYKGWLPSILHRMQLQLTCKISSVVSESVARAEPSARRGSRPRVMRVCLAGASPEQVQLRLSVVSTGTATVSTGMLGRYLATSRAVEPPRVRTTIKEACTYAHKVMLSRHSCLQAVLAPSSKHWHVAFPYDLQA